ncbi:MAG: carbohydrate porin [Polyangiaceae bacterium]
MRRVHQLLGLSGLFVMGLVSTRAFAQPADDDVDPDARPDTTAPKDAHAAPAPAAATPAPEAAATPAEDAAAPAAKPKFGDLTTSGYFRGGFGGSSQKGRMTCFALANPQGLVSKYRLGNECEVWAEFGLHTVVYAGSDGSVAHLHFMPTAFIPNTYIGYPSTGVTSSDLGSPGTGATVAFPNLYVDIQGIPWLAGGTAWVGTRYYKRESVYISDFFYWNPSGVGAGIEDINLGKDLRLSYAAFAVDGQPNGMPQLPMQVDFGVRNDVQLRGIKPYPGGEFQVGFQYIADLSSNKDQDGALRQPDGSKVTHGGWGVTLQHVQQVLGGDNKLALQYGKGGGTGFGTLARFYYPDFSLYHDPAETRFRLVDVLTVQPLDSLGGQAAFVYQHDDQGNASSKTTWMSAGARVAYAFTEHAKLIGEVGYDHVTKSNGSDPQMLTKLTIAPAITAGKGFNSRPELRLFYTWAMWNEAARGATVDSGRIYTTTNKLSGATFGLQGETWW